MSECRRELTVQPKDCYDPADYVLVHKDRLRALLELARRRREEPDVLMSTTSFAHDGDGREV